MQKRMMMLPLIWAAFGIGEVFGLTYIFGSILNDIQFPPNDKPIGGSYLPALFFNVAAIFLMIGLSLYCLGIWNIDFSNRKVRTDLIALGVMFTSGFLVFYYAIFLFPLAVALVYFLATNID
jgi:hypothetical protein